MSVCQYVCQYFTVSFLHKPPEEIEGDDELEELIKPPRPASPVDYTESNLCKFIM